VRVQELGAGTSAADIRGLTPDPRDVEDDVRAIVGEVRRDGDAALVRLTERFDGARLEEGGLSVPLADARAAVATLDSDVLEGLRTAIANVRAVAEAQLRGDVGLDLPEGQRVEIAELAVGRAGAYVPAGRAAYPSSLIMVTVAARAAGVGETAICAAPAEDGRIHPLILATCALCEVDEIYRVGGAQAIAALAYGTESVRPVDVVAGPGNRWVQEAKRQVAGAVGIDGIAGPSELVIVADGGQEPEPLALDLMAQAEHGADSLVAIVSPDRELLDAVRGAVERMAADRPSVTDAPLAIVQTEDVETAIRLAEEIAPEHLQLAGPAAEELAPTIRAAGCLFVGAAAATAFGDYVAGSNHVLPTGAAARFQSGVSPATFRRRMARVSFPGEAAARLAAKGAPLARAEGFPVHAESMERRA
jgi:histidinol dehydrogenase